MIEIPPKIWRPKVLSRWKPVELADDIDDGIFDYTSYGGNCVFRPSSSSPVVPVRDDIILFDPLVDDAEFNKTFSLDPSIPSELKQHIKSIVIKYWDCFCKRGVHRHILGFEFGIDTGTAEPVSCSNQSYGFHEARIIMEQIVDLLKNDWIEECLGPWASKIVLAPKPHQEHVNDIDDFIWRMCVSYRALNGVTKPFAYPMSRCDDSVAFICGGGRYLYFITVDCRQGYHQITVRVFDREKLAFYAPNGKKYCFKVMPFGPMNAPTFYTCIMVVLKTEWDILFLTRLRAMGSIGGTPIIVISFDEIYIGPYRIVIGSKTIIDDILLYCCNRELLLLYFDCVCAVFLKYRVSFRLDKCDFLNPRVSFVGHDITSEGNCPARAKFDMINDWKLPTNGQHLLSFISLCNFYARFSPCFELRLKALRRLAKCYFRKTIPATAWTPELETMFKETKECITSSPVLVRYDPTLPIFLKTDWSATGMSWILMQPSRDDASLAAVKLLLETGENKFDLTTSGERLLPLAFGSRACNDSEQHYHSFVGEAGAGRWAMGQNKKHLWGSVVPFYWLCDCLAMKEIFDYSGSIAQVARWAQEMLGYNFVIVHRSNKMMIDVDALNRIYGKRISLYIAFTSYLRNRDEHQRPFAYEPSVFFSAVKVKLPQSTDFSAFSLDDVYTESFIYKAYASISSPLGNHDSCISITSQPIFWYSPPLNTTSLSPASSYDVQSHAWTVFPATSMNWLCLNDTFGICHHAVQACDWSISCTFSNLFTAPSAFQLFSSHTSEKGDFVPSSRLSASLTTALQHIHIFHACFIPGQQQSAVAWIQSIVAIISSLLPSLPDLNQVTLWLPASHLPLSMGASISPFIEGHLSPLDWRHTVNYMTSTDFGSCVAASRCVIFMAQSEETALLSCPMVDTDILSPAYSSHINQHESTLESCVLSVSSSTPSNYTSLPTTPCLYALLTHSGTDDGTAASFGSVILADSGPCTEPLPVELQNNILGRRFGIPFDITDTSTKVRSVTSSELLRCYGINHLTSDVLPEAALDDLLPCSIPIHLLAAVIRHWDTSESFLDNFVFADTTTCDSLFCYNISTSPPPTLDWPAAYAQDSDTHNILCGLRNHKANDWTSAELSSIPPSYHSKLKEGTIVFWNQKLVYTKCIFPNKKYIALIVVPQELRQRIFDHFHSGPSGAHMGEYKTLFRIRLRFFWPGLRQDIKGMIKSCAHCNAYDHWKSRRNELYFSWPITTPFYIMHLDLWHPGKTATYTSKHGMLLNCMCDMSQFVVSIIADNASASHLAKLYMENVILTFGMCAIVVVDADNSFRGVFEEMCTILKIHFWPLARGNHKGLIVERYHRFFNKIQTIIGEERGTHISFLQTCKTAQYAWNSAPIDGTDVTRSMVALGRDFLFPLDVEFSALPTELNDESNTALFQYLRDVSNDSAFAREVVKLLIEERRDHHRQLHNKNKVAPQFKVGDVVKVHIQVTSKQDENKVAKLSYQVRGPFQIMRDLQTGSYEVQRYGEPESALRKYKATELYLLPPTLYPSEPLDTMDQRYIDFDHAPIVSPLMKPLRIELYNETTFKPHTSHITSNNNKPSTQLDQTALLQPHTLPPKPLITESPPAIPSQISPAPSHPSSLQSLHERILTSNDKLFFIKFTPANTLRSRWYLIQVDIASTEEQQLNPTHTNKYWCIFHAKHPSDNKKSDETGRWWPLWHKYTFDEPTNMIIYGDRILFRPNMTPNADKYIQWAEDINLHDVTLFGPFDFDPINATNRTRNIVSLKHWRKLKELCIDHHLIPPTFGAKSSHIPSKKTQTKHKKQKKHT